MMPGMKVRTIPFLILTICLTGKAWPQVVSSERITTLSASTVRLIAEVDKAYEQIDLKLADGRLSGSISEKLILLGEADQIGRTVLDGLDLKSIPASEVQTARNLISTRIVQRDVQNINILRTLIPPNGWFRITDVGQKASTAAFLVVQHAVNDRILMKTTLAKLEEFVKVGEASGSHYALMYDRVALLFENKPQRYGTQIRCVDGFPTVPNLEDADNVNARRKSVGLAEPLEVYLLRHKARCRLS